VLCEDLETASHDVVVKHELVLRQWQDINTGHEFRCFVKDNKLIGVLIVEHISCI
jgi:D-alanine-D-alanine ligase-like ATP-grasp enzyme